jgi:hypothetical protein
MSRVKLKAKRMRELKMKVPKFNDNMSVGTLYKVMKQMGAMIYKKQHETT